MSNFIYNYGFLAGHVLGLLMVWPIYRIVDRYFDYDLFDVLFPVLSAVVWLSCIVGGSLLGQHLGWY